LDSSGRIGHLYSNSIREKDNSKKCGCKRQYC